MTGPHKKIDASTADTTDTLRKLELKQLCAHINLFESELVFNVYPHDIDQRTGKVINHMRIIGPTDLIDTLMDSLITFYGPMPDKIQERPYTLPGYVREPATFNAADFGIIEISDNAIVKELVKHGLQTEKKTPVHAL